MEKFWFTKWATFLKFGFFLLPFPQLQRIIFSKLKIRFRSCCIIISSKFELFFSFIFRRPQKMCSSSALFTQRQLISVLALEWVCPFSEGEFMFGLHLIKKNNQFHLVILKYFWYFLVMFVEMFLFAKFNSNIK